MQALLEDNNHETVSENSPVGEASESEGEETTVPLVGGSISPDELIEQMMKRYGLMTPLNTTHHLIMKSKLEKRVYTWMTFSQVAIESILTATCHKTH